MKKTYSQRIDLTGKTFGSLYVIELAELRERADGKYDSIWLCKCNCGNTVKVHNTPLTMGRKLSCGCVKFNEEKQGELGHHIYDIYKQMTHRCYGKSYKDYKNYGARGIQICKEWFDVRQDYDRKKKRFKYNDKRYLNFYNWSIANNYQVGLTIDRIDNNGNYEPSNCRWATLKQQANNTRMNRLITVNNETHTLAEWAERLGVDQAVISERIKNGWTEEKAVFTPISYNSKTHRITIDGVTKSAAGWSKEVNIAASTIINRLKKGWTEKEAVYGK